MLKRKRKELVATGYSIISIIQSMDQNPFVLNVYCPNPFLWEILSDVFLDLEPMLCFVSFITLGIHRVHKWMCMCKWKIQQAD